MKRPAPTSSTTESVTCAVTNAARSRERREPARASASSVFRAVTMSTREACSAGASPKTTPVETETAKVKASTR